MINTRYTTPTDNMIGSVMKSGEEGQYDWGQTQKSSDDSIRKLKAELYLRLNEKKLPDEKAKIIQKAFRKRNNKTQKKEKKRTRSPSPSVSPDPELSGINSEFYNYEGNMIEPIAIGSPKKVSSEPTLTKLLSPSPTKKSKSAENLEAIVYQDRRAHTPSKGLAEEFNRIFTFEEQHKQREQRGGNPEKISYLERRIDNIDKQILDLKEKKDSKGRVIEFLDDDSRIPKIIELELEKKDLINRKEKLESKLSLYDQKYAEKANNLLLEILKQKEKTDELLKENPKKPSVYGGKKKSRRKLRKSGRKTKRRK